MTVTPYDRCRYIVTVHAEDFTVDLLRYDGNGECDCWHFKKHIRPEIERAIAAGAFVPSNATKCAHIVQADSVLLNHFKRELMKQFPDHDQEKQP